MISKVFTPLEILSSYVCLSIVVAGGGVKGERPTFPLGPCRVGNQIVESESSPTL